MKIKRTVGLVLTLSLVLAGATPLFAETVRAPKLVRLEGWVVDSWCGKDNANVDKADCVYACQKKGATLVFYTPSDKKTYEMADQEAALEHVGRKMKVIGSLNDAGSLVVGSWIEPKQSPPQSES